MRLGRSTPVTLAIGSWIASMALAVLGYERLSGSHGGARALATTLATVAMLVTASLFAGAIARGTRRAARRLYVGQVAFAVAFVVGSVAQVGVGRSGRMVALALAALVAGYLAQRLASDAPAPGRSLAQRGVSIIVELTYCLSAAILALLGLFIGGMRCDDRCSAGGYPGVEWTEVSGAWQWRGLIAASVVLFFAGLLFAATVGAMRRSRWPLVPYALQLGATVVGLAILASAADRFQFAIPFVWMAGTQALALIALLRRRRDGATETLQLSTQP
jgi:hypothetical protein